MGILYSNIPLTKETAQPTILQMYITAEGTLIVKDYTLDVYNNSKKLVRNIKFVSPRENEYEIQLHPFKENDGLIIGLHIAEGHDIRFEFKKEPIFFQKKDNITMDLKGFLNNKITPKSTIGIYHVGTKIYYKPKKRSYVDELTKDGWKTNNPHKIKSVSDVANDTQNNNNSSIENKKKIAKELLNAKEITSNLYYRYLHFIGEKRELNLNFLTAEEAALLKTKGL